MRAGLYIHIPFCSFLCHYCDFAKTANFDAMLVQDYFVALERQLRWLAAHIEAATGRQLTFPSVYLGGGTPGIFTDEYRGLFRFISQRMESGTEVTIECNPANVNRSALEVWRSLGINRLSIGVQSLQARGLKVLTRDHDASTALGALELAMRVIPNVNMDLIYGWPGQTPEEWLADLSGLVRSGVPHASLYTLTFEERTPFGRMARRGRIFPERDDALAQDYSVARETLGAAGFEHDEVSNWARPGFTCHHNWLYWDFKPFLAVGAGAHGFMPSRFPGLVSAQERDGADVDAFDIGVRWAFPRDVRSYLRHLPAQPPESGDFHSLLNALGAEVDAARDHESALIEYVGGSLRTRHGVDLNLAESIAGRRFTPRPAIEQAIRMNLAWRDGPRLRFSAAEWFRENSWASEVLMGF
ncbi:MAG: hypothetical protein RIQ81_269 [Pseudomonadota bacterium]